MEGKAGGALWVFAGCSPDLLGLPYRASRLDGGGCEALWGLRAAARTCLPCRASPLDGWVRGNLWVFAGCCPDLLLFRGRRWDGKGDGYS